jgi:hypothetical protein
MLSVLTRNHVSRSQCGGRSNDETFFTMGDLQRLDEYIDCSGLGIYRKAEGKAYHVEANATVSLCIEHDTVHDINLAKEDSYISPVTSSK